MGKFHKSLSHYIKSNYFCRTCIQCNTVTGECTKYGDTQLSPLLLFHERSIFFVCHCFLFPQKCKDLDDWFSWECILIGNMRISRQKHSAACRCMVVYTVQKFHSKKQCEIMQNLNTVKNSKKAMLLSKIRESEKSEKFRSDYHLPESHCEDCSDVAYTVP